MTATAHALVAGAILRAVPDTVSASLLAIASHYIMDSIPHWDVGTHWRGRPKSTTGMLATLDTVLGFTVAYILFAGKMGIVPVTLVTVASLLPDWLEAPWYIFFAHQKKHGPGPRANLGERLAYHVYKIPNAFHTKAQLPFGLITQIATVTFFWLLLQ